MCPPHNEPLVSVVIAAYNAGDYLRPAVESVLQQSHRELEILLIDDGSTDGSVEKLSHIDDSRFRILHQENSGKPAAVNRALDLVEGEFYAIQDADDLSHPRRIERQLACFQQHPELAGVFTGYELLIDERPVAPRFRAKSAAECATDIDQFAMPSHDPTGMYRMSMVGEFRYAEDLQIGEGHDYILRIGEAHPLMVVGECLYSYRILPDSLTRSDPERRRRFVHEVLGRACERRGLDVKTIIQDLDHGFDQNEKDNNLVAHFLESAVDQREAGEWMGAVQTGVYCLSRHPADPVFYKPLALALLPGPIARRVRRRSR
ncbi:MAG: glycosyltransferase family A protein [Myxococcota bacterium]